MTFAVIGLLACSSPAHAQRKKDKNKKQTEQPAKSESKNKSIADLTKSCKKYEGLFTIYQDTITGASWMEVAKNQLDKEFIYFSFIEDGVMDAGFFRGAYRGSKVIRFKRYFERIEIHEENTDFYYSEDNALSKAGKANINTPILASEKIEAYAKNDSIFLISADKIFLSENFQMVKPPSSPEFPSLLGGLSKDKTKINNIRSYPENTDISVSYVYDNPSPRFGGSSAVTDVRYITVKYQHSLIEMPDDSFSPRRDDARIGYFMSQVTDMTSFDVAPYRDMSHRWRLIKKDPGAPLSEPVEPIVWWIENTTPVEFRDIIKDGVERWNLAFEKAGFKNAVVVKVQPDDADWDAGDIRYNVLRWTSSPMPPFGGYGPSFVNPRTGEILGADIMLEFTAIKGRLFRKEVFELAGLESFDVTSEELSADMHRCDAGQIMGRNMLFGVHALRAQTMDAAAEEEFVKQTLQRLVLHEVGHTLGLSHNMHASTMLSPEEIKNPEIVAQNGLCNSVMEYPAINFALDKKDQTVYYDGSPGPYDYWVIEYGYSEALADPVKEEQRLQQILARSTDPLLKFGNDADDMRSPGRGINPDVNIFDLSSDPVAYGAERCELVIQTLPKIFEAYTAEGKSYEELRAAYFALTGEYATQIQIMTRQIGGVRYDRSVVGQNTDAKPLEPVSEKDQKAALAALNTYAFSPAAFDVPEGMYNYLLAQRRGFNHFSSNDDPRIHDRIMAVQASALVHLLHPNVLKRIIDSQEYGNTYDLGEYMTELTNIMFKDDINATVNSKRQNLQSMYVDMLIKMLDEKSRQTMIAQNMALYELNRIRKTIAASTGGDVLTKAHRAALVQSIDDALSNN
ncbi:MAG: hypothetical protein RL226_789 [Bacteroidota bacterium]